MSSSDSCSRETSSDDPEGGRKGEEAGQGVVWRKGINCTFECTRIKLKKTLFQQRRTVAQSTSVHSVSTAVTLHLHTTLRSADALTVGVIPKSCVEEDAGFLL